MDGCEQCSFENPDVDLRFVVVFWASFCCDLVLRFFGIPASDLVLRFFLFLFLLMYLVLVLYINRVGIDF